MRKALSYFRESLSPYLKQKCLYDNFFSPVAKNLLYNYYIQILIHYIIQLYKIIISHYEVKKIAMMMFFFACVIIKNKGRNL